MVWTVGLQAGQLQGLAAGPCSLAFGFLSLREACAQENLCLCPTLQVTVSTGFHVWELPPWGVCVCVPVRACECVVVFAHSIFLGLIGTPLTSGWQNIL